MTEANTETYTFESTRGLVAFLAKEKYISRQWEPVLNKANHRTYDKEGKTVYQPTDFVKIRVGPHKGLVLETGSLKGTLHLFSILEQDGILWRESESHKFKTPRFGWDDILECPCHTFPHNVHKKMPDGTVRAFSSEARAEKVIALLKAPPSASDFTHSLSGEMEQQQDQKVQEDQESQEDGSVDQASEKVAQQSSADMPYMVSPPQGYMVMMNTPFGLQWVFVQSKPGVFTNNILRKQKFFYFLNLNIYFINLITFIIII